MTIEQAVAILEAERVLQAVGCEGPDSVPGTAWFGYVKEAAGVIASDKLFCNCFNDLYLVQDITAGA